MSKFTRYVSCIAIAIGLFACSEKPIEVIEPIFEVDQTAIKVRSLASLFGSVEFRITSNQEWTIEGDNEWCKASKLSGKGYSIISLEIQNNTVAIERKVEYKLKSGSLSRTVTVTQDPWSVSDIPSDEMKTMTTLKIVGKISDLDYATIRENMPALKTLDLSEVTDLVLKDYAFSQNKSITKIILPKCMTEIGEGAFSGSNLEEIVWPDKLEVISICTFRNCTKLKGDLVIPPGVTKIKEDAFSGCSGFTGALQLPKSITEIGPGAFYKCIGFTGQLIIPNGVKIIEESTFETCTGFTGPLLLPNSVTDIGERAFVGCNGFTSLTLPANIENIGDAAFFQCWRMTGKLVLPKSIKNISEHAFYDCSGFTSLDIPDGITTIASGAFHNFSGLSGTLLIPASVRSIEWSAFSDCRNITSVKLEQGLEAIGNSAFSNCLKISGRVDIPSSVKKIGMDAFSYCPGVSEFRVAWSAPIPYVKTSPISTVFSLQTPLLVPVASLAAYQAAEGWSDHNLVGY